MKFQSLLIKHLALKTSCEQRSKIKANSCNNWWLVNCDSPVWIIITVGRQIDWWTVKHHNIYCTCGGTSWERVACYNWDLNYKCVKCSLLVWRITCLFLFSHLTLFSFTSYNIPRGALTKKLSLLTFFVLLCREE